jgi:hypothetical protein
MNEAVVADAKSPQVGRPLQVDASMLWIVRDSLNTRDDPSRRTGL